MNTNEQGAQMSDTPRTDAAAVDLQEAICTRVLSNGRREYIWKYVPIDISRQLERELAAARRDAEEAKATLQAFINNQSRRNVPVEAPEKGGE